MEQKYTQIALIYAYKTKDAIKYGFNPNEIYLAYQIKNPGFPDSNNQCDYGKPATAYTLKEFKKTGGIVKVVNGKRGLVLPLDSNKVQVPVPEHLLKDWGLTDLID